MTGRKSIGLLLLIAALCAVLTPAGNVRAQGDLQSTLEQYAGKSVTGYVQPVADMFGANMNSGFFHNAAIEKWGFHFKLELVGMASLVQDAQKVYTAYTPDPWGAPFETATIFGGKGGSISGLGGAVVYRGSDGLFNTNFFPLAAPQIEVGDIYGTRLLLRLILTPELDKVGKVTYWAVGAQHSISQYLPMIPVDLAGHIVMSRLTVGDIITAKGMSIGVDASKGWAIFTLYGGLAWESSSLQLTYQPTDPTNTLPPVDLTLDGKQAFRFKAGLNIGLGPIALFGDANFGSVTVLSAGIGFGI